MHKVLPHTGVCLRESTAKENHQTNRFLETSFLKNSKFLHPSSYEAGEYLLLNV